MKKNLLIITLFISCFSFMLFTGCGKKLRYKVELIKNEKSCINNADTIAPSITKVNVYLEASIGMKGYINHPSQPDEGFVLKRILPKLITDLSGTEFDLATYAIYQQTRPKNTNALVRDLLSGDIFSGGSNMKYYFPEVIDGNQESEISIIISDFIFDDVSNFNIAETERVRRAIYSSLTSRNLASILYMYYSDFNSEWYYNMTTSERPFRNPRSIMKKRPFYIWIIGTPLSIKTFLDRKLIADYDEMFTYGLFTSETIDYKLIESYKTGQVAVVGSMGEFVAYKPKGNNQFKILAALSLDNFPTGLRNINYLSDNLELSHGFLDKNVVAQIIEKEQYLDSLNIKSSQKLKIQDEIQSYSHIIEFTINNIQDIPMPQFSVFLKHSGPQWIKNVHLDDDREISTENMHLLEGKTPLFNIPSRAFSDRFFHDKCNLFEIVFTKK